MVSTARPAAGTEQKAQSCLSAICNVERATSSHNQQRLTNGSLLEDLLADYSTAPPAGPHHSLPSDLRADMMESISSMKITLGCITPATANSTFTCMQERPKNQLSSGSTLHQFKVATAWVKIQSRATSIIVVYGTVQCSTVLKRQSSDTSSGGVQAAPPPFGCPKCESPHGSNTG